MNKWPSFGISFMLATVAGFVYTKAGGGGEPGLTAFLIYWYMIWKLLHNKKDDKW